MAKIITWGMVTTYSMSENKMEYRGSKSVLDSSTVKEQRVDGNLKF